MFNDERLSLRTHSGRRLYWELGGAASKNVTCCDWWRNSITPYHTQRSASPHAVVRYPDRYIYVYRTAFCCRLRPPALASEVKKIIDQESTRGLYASISVTKLWHFLLRSRICSYLCSLSLLSGLTTEISSSLPGSLGNRDEAPCYPKSRKLRLLPLG